MMGTAAIALAASTLVAAFAWGMVDAVRGLNSNGDIADLCYLAGCVAGVFGAPLCALMFVMP